MRHASTTMSCVDEENATTRARTPIVARPAVSPAAAMASRPTRRAAGDEHPAAPPAEPPEPAARHAIDDRRPQEFQRVGEAHPGQESDRGQRGSVVAQPVPSVLPVRKKGRPDEKPSMSITATFGWPSDAGPPLRLLDGRRAAAIWSESSRPRHSCSSARPATSALRSASCDRRRRRRVCSRSRRRPRVAWNSPSCRCGSAGCRSPTAARRASARRARARRESRARARSPTAGSPASRATWMP